MQRSPSPAFAVAPLLLAVLLGCGGGGGAPAAPPPAPAQMHFRTLQPTEESTAEFAARLRRARQPRQFGVASFPEPPGPDQRRALAGRGIRILSHFQGTTYRVEVARGWDAKLIDAGVRLALLEPADRVAPALWTGAFATYVTRTDSGTRNWVLRPDGTLDLTVVFHPTLSDGEAEGVLRRWGRDARKLGDARYRVRVPRESLPRLAAEEAVQWIDAAPMPTALDNDFTRVAMHVDEVQAYDAGTATVRGLGGLGVQVGIFDSGVHEAHGDFEGRVVRAQPYSAFHGTLVAGVALGSGAASAGSDVCGAPNRGTAGQWRGMAPQAGLVEADSHEEDVVATLASIVALGMDVSNHSYSISYDGAYDAGNELRDQQIRGDATHGGVAVPPRLQVWSAGNHGAEAVNGGTQVGYFSITKQMKNALVVGNWSRYGETVFRTSSRGPAHDGRIKPDVVAPGTEISSTSFGDVCHDRDGRAHTRTGNYQVQTGTSLSAPAVTGAIALVLQQLSGGRPESLDAHPPLPSTLRALMVHTARDLSGAQAREGTEPPWQAYPGPDYYSGWGMVNAQAAVQAARAGLFLEELLIATCDAAAFDVEAPADGSALRVTLAWDDPAGNPALASTAPHLVNDLDLVLIAPDGTRHYPWLLDQQAVDAGGAPVADAAQGCGAALAVRRQVLPGVGRADALPEAGLAARRGRDHLNNVEQVVVERPARGTWRAQVLGFNVAMGPQRFSLVGVQRDVSGLGRVPHPCASVPWLCTRMFRPRGCDPAVGLCDPFAAIRAGRWALVRFRGPEGRSAMLLDALCPNGCGAMTLDLNPRGAPYRLEVYDAAGKRVRSGGRLSLDAGEAKGLVLVATATRQVTPGVEYAIPLFRDPADAPR